MTLCSLFGHDRGRAYPNQYNHVSSDTDGIGRTHITVAKRCHRCNKNFDHKNVCLDMKALKHLWKASGLPNLNEYPVDGKK